MRLAIIDLGSNTCRLVIFALTPEGAFRLTDQVSETARIGEGMFTSASNTRLSLRAEPMRRVIELLKMYAALCRSNQIETVIATATSAVRDAANGAEFIERVLRDTGLALRILSGQEEAYYGYLGAINTLTLRDGIIVDLGGGSLEATRVENRLPIASASLPLGAVRLADEFLHGDPIPKGSAKIASAYIQGQFEAFPWLRLGRGETLVALGGSVRALAQVDQRRRGYPMARLHGYTIGLDAVEAMTDELFKKDLAARAKIKGLKGERADIIPAGALVIRELMQHTGAAQLVVSGRGLRDGLFYETVLKDGTARVPLVPDVRAFGVANLSFLYALDWAHARQVCGLALQLFDDLAALHGLNEDDRALLIYAALLHDCGVLVDYYRHQYHSAYLIENADLPGFSHRDIAYLALLVRWHRRGDPELEPYDTLLNQNDLARIEKLVAFLRMAEDLERSRAQLVSRVEARVRGNEIRIEAFTRQTAEAELWAASRETGLWETAFGKQARVVARAQLEPMPNVDEQGNVMSRAESVASVVEGLSSKNPST